MADQGSDWRWLQGVWQTGQAGAQVSRSHESCQQNFQASRADLSEAVRNPAVQIEKIKKHATGVQALKDRLKYWDYQRVFELHQALESVNEEIIAWGWCQQSHGKKEHNSTSRNRGRS